MTHMRGQYAGVISAIFKNWNLVLYFTIISSSKESWPYNRCAIVFGVLKQAKADYDIMFYKSHLHEAKIGNASPACQDELASTLSVQIVGTFSTLRKC